MAERWLIAGRVQGVGFRAWMERQARALGIDGWVRNLPDGRVEAIVEGERDRLAKLLAACRTGPSHARVARIDVAPAAGVSVGEGFQQRPDAA